MKGFASIAGGLLIASIILLSIITFVSFIIDIKKKKSFKNTCLISLSSLLYFILFVKLFLLLLNCLFPICIEFPKKITYNKKYASIKVKKV